MKRNIVTLHFIFCRLDELLLTNEVFNKFLKALKAVAMPESILLCHLMKLKQICRERNADDFNNYSAAILEELYSEKPNSKNADNFFGNMFKKISNYKDQISNLRKSKLVINQRLFFTSGCSRKIQP